MVDCTACSLAALRLIHWIAPILKRFWRFNGVVLYLPRGVFNPVLTLSSSLLLRLLKKYAEGVVVELGCGSGAVSLAVAREKGVKVVGNDVDPLAVAVARLNARINNLNGKVLCYLSKTPIRVGESVIVAINPPYLRCPARRGDHAWCGGRGLEIFSHLLLEGLRLRPRYLIFTFSSLTGRPIYYLLARMRLRVVDAMAIKLPFETIYAVVVEGKG